MCLLSILAIVFILEVPLLVVYIVFMNTFSHPLDAGNMASCGCNLVDDGLYSVAISKEND